MRSWLFCHSMTWVIPKKRQVFIIGKGVKSGAQGIKMHGAWPTFSESITLCLCTRTIKENENTHIYFYTTMQLKKQYNIEGFALYRFLPGLAAHRAGRGILRPALIARHDGKIWVYGLIWPKNPIIGHTNPFKSILKWLTTWIYWICQAARAIGRTRERICFMRPALTWPRAIAIITAVAKPSLVCILAFPRM